MKLKDLLGEGYKDDLTIEDITKALEPLNFVAQAEHDTAIAAMKDSVSKANSEAADFKRQLRERMSEEERAEAARKEAEGVRAKELTDLQTKVAELTKASKLAEVRTQFLESGYAKDLAEKAANALLSNDSAALVEAQAAHLTAREAQLKAELLGNTPRPGAAPTQNVSGGVDTKVSAQDEVNQTLEGFLASHPPGM